jgi:diketogulonate reductase-like aldo/keto reductase
MKIQQDFTLINGVKIPVVGFGTWQIRPGKAAYDSVSFALKSGYRHIDTAYAYGNEKSVGNAVRHSGIPRNEIFVTSKLPAEIKSYDGALKYFDRTIENLSLDYVDLYLIHAPWPWGKKGEDFTKENINVWRAMEEIYTTGHCRAIGVSNFSVYDLTAVMDNCTIIPMANQIKYHIGYTQEEVTQFCLKNNILVEGYSPLASGAITDNREITAIAQKYNITVPQICIRYVLQKGVIPLPKSTHTERILQNLDIGFTIEEEDMNLLDELRDTV